MEHLLEWPSNNLNTCILHDMILADDNARKLADKYKNILMFEYDKEKITKHGMVILFLKPRLSCFASLGMRPPS